MALALPTASYQIWASAQSRNMAIEQARFRIDELTRRAVVEQTEGLHDAANLLRVLKRVPAVESATPGECHQLLREIANEHLRLDMMAIMRPDGSITCTSTDVAPPTFKVADRLWFQQAIALDAPETVTSDLLISRINGTPAVIVATPCATRADGRRGVISALLSLPWFEDIATSLSASAGGAIQLVTGRDGTVISQSPKPATPIERQTLPPKLAEMIKTSDHGITEIVTPEGETRLVGYRWLPGDAVTHSAVIVSLNKAVIAGEADQHLVFGLLTDAAALTCGVLIAWAVAEISIVRPLSSLARMAVSFGSGNLDARVRVEEFTVAELKILGRTLNRAVEQVQLRDHELEKLTLRDPLTGLANRRCFDSTLERIMKRANRSNMSVALIMVDVDYFKLYNDTYGHLAGDECLRNIAHAIAKRARSADDTVARYGGEEIALLIPNIDVHDACSMAERVVLEIRNLELPHRASPTDWVSVSAGLAIITPGLDGSDAHHLIEAADRALYEAKHSGRNRAVCSVDLATIGS